MELLSRPSFVAAALRWWDLCANSLRRMKYFKRQPHNEARQRVPLHRWHENAWLPQKMLHSRHGPTCCKYSRSDVSPPKAQVCSRLRKAKFIAIPLDPGSGGTGPCCSQMGTIGRISMEVNKTQRIPHKDPREQWVQDGARAADTCKAHLSRTMADLLGTKGASTANVHGSDNLRER